MPTKRQSIRLRNFDYGSEGGYFITICTYERLNVFGEIINGRMNENTWGQIVRDEWYKTAHVRSNINLDAFIIMPNHVHGIIIINGVGATRRVARTDNNHYTIQSGSLGAIIGQFKSIVAKRINGLCNTHGRFIWQRNYHEHIIRNELELNQIRQYIIDNPANWDQDEENIQLTFPILGV